MVASLFVGQISNYFSFPFKPGSVMGELLSLPEAPLLALSARDDQGPDGCWRDQSHNVAMLGASKVWSTTLYQAGTKCGSDFFIASKWDCHEPPWVIMERSIIIAFVEAM